jgi:molybdopterin-guanine dinucleotide biosynthesis protein A
VADLVGVVLAGGASRRMGRTKALIEIDGVPMVRRVVDALAAAGCAPVVVVGGDPGELASVGLQPVADHQPGEGPLGGILTALRVEDTDLLVAACDLPDLTAEAVRTVAIAGAADVDVAVAADGHGHAALLRVNRRAEPALERAFAAGERRLGAALEHCRTVAVEVAAGTLRNVNEPADLDARGSRAG